MSDEWEDDSMYLSLAASFTEDIDDTAANDHQYDAHVETRQTVKSAADPGFITSDREPLINLQTTSQHATLPPDPGFVTSNNAPLINLRTASQPACYVTT